MTQDWRISCRAAVALLVFLLMSSQAQVEGRPGGMPTDVAAVADALKYLQELDRYYSQIARPREPRSGSPGDQQLLQVERAIKLLQLHHLDRFYLHYARPRYGKRDGVQQQSILPEAEGDDYWLGTEFARR